MYQHYLNPFPSSQVAMFSPMAIPEILAQTQVSDYWQLIHWLTQNEWNKILVHISSVLF